jgi:hypothetical protein
VPYLKGLLTIERVIRPGVVEELLRLVPEDGSPSVVFDLEDALQRTGLCELIRECQGANAVLLLNEQGQIVVPPALEKRFEFYREFYGVGTEMLKAVELLRSGKKSESKKNASDGASSMKKLTPEEEAPVPKKPKNPKVSKKLDPKNLNIVPAGIMVIAEGSVKSPTSPAGPGESRMPLSGSLGSQKPMVRSFALGKAAISLRSTGGPSFGTSRR